MLMMMLVNRGWAFKILDMVLKFGRGFAVCEGGFVYLFTYLFMTEMMYTVQ